MEMTWRKGSWQIRLLEMIFLILEGHGRTGGGSFFLLLKVRLKGLFLCLFYIVAFAVMFLVAVIDSHR